MRQGTSPGFVLAGPSSHSDSLCRYTGVPYDQGAMRISLGGIPLMEAGQPLDFDTTAASAYLKDTTSTHGTVEIGVSIGASWEERAQGFGLTSAYRTPWNRLWQKRPPCCYTLSHSPAHGLQL